MSIVITKVLMIVMMHTFKTEMIKIKIVLIKMIKIKMVLIKMIKIKMVLIKSRSGCAESN